MLELQNLNKVFEKEGNHEVIDDISMQAKDGEFVCILGPSGSGKTIFLYLIAGLLHPSSGKVLLDGKIVTKPTTDRMMVFQDYALFPWKTVYGNVMFGLEKSKLTPEQKKQVVLNHLRIVGLQDYKNWHIHKLSGGMKQRVAIARALVSDPKVLLMDEPFAALDSQYRKYMRQNLEKIWQDTKKTVIFVTHSVTEAIYLADTIHLFSSLPAKIKQTYHIDLPRPRDPRSEEFVKLTRVIEEEATKEFERTLREGLDQDPPFDGIITKY